MEALTFFRSFYQPKSVVGVSYRSQGDSESYFVCLLRRHKNDMVLEETAAFSSLDELVVYCQKHPTVPVGLHIQGKGILIRELSAQATPDTDTIKAVFPAFSKDTHYYSILEGKEKCWVSLAKRGQVDSILTMLGEKGIHPVQLFIGPFVLDNVLQHLNVYNREYRFDGHLIQIDSEGRWDAYAQGDAYVAKFQSKIGTDKIAQEGISAYATAFHVLMADYVTDYSLAVPQVADSFDAQRQKTIFQVNLLMILVGVFVLLLVSTILHTVYFQKNEARRIHSGAVTSAQQDWKSQLAKSVQKDSLLIDLGWNGGVSTAWLLDRIGVSMDSFPSITLTHIQINPSPERKKRADELATDNRNRIVLQGRCTSLATLNTWIRNLSQEQWAEKVSIAQFTPALRYDEEGQVFRLDITFGYGS